MHRLQPFVAQRAQWARRRGSGARRGRSGFELAATACCVCPPYAPCTTCTHCSLRGAARRALRRAVLVACFGRGLVVGPRSRVKASLGRLQPQVKAEPVLASGRGGSPGPSGLVPGGAAAAAAGAAGVAARRKPRAAFKRRADSSDDDSDDGSDEGGGEESDEVDDAVRGSLG
jgi:hypothetical protein